MLRVIYRQSAFEFFSIMFIIVPYWAYFINSRLKSCIRTQIEPLWCRQLIHLPWIPFLELTLAKSVTEMNGLLATLKTCW